MIINWCFSDPATRFSDSVKWFRNALERDRFTILNEVILDLQEYGVHHSENCVQPYIVKQIPMYKCTECLNRYVQPYTVHHNILYNSTEER